MTNTQAASRRLTVVVGLALLVTSMLGCQSNAPSAAATLPTAAPTQLAPTQPAPTQAAQTQAAPSTQATSYPAAESVKPAEATAYPAAIAATPSAVAPTAKPTQPTPQPKAAQNALKITIAHTNDVSGEVDPCG